MSILDKLRTRYKVWCRVCGHMNSDMALVHEVMEEAAQEIKRLTKRLDDIQLAYVAATNPGIDMEQVKRTRTCGPACSEAHTYIKPCVLDGDAQVLAAARASNREWARAQEQRAYDAMRSPDA
jgi:hypothetical protein